MTPASVQATNTSNLRVALVHDWLTGMRGGEKVLEALCSFFPRATLFTLYHHKGAMSPVIEGMKIEASWISKLPWAQNHFRKYLPLFPAAIESFNLSDYQLVISTSHCVAKGAIPAPQALHVSYLHTPMRYIWEMYPHYLGAGAGWVKKAAGSLLASYLRSWDVASVNRVDHFIANSENVRQRIWRHYRREAEVIYPPVEAELFQPTSASLNRRGDYFLIVTALVPYKQVALAVEAFNQLGERLVIVGDGPEKETLRRRSKSHIQFLPWQSGAALRDVYLGCRALIFPGEEDFGIVPLEAQACGKPVIAYGKGGVLETVIPANVIPQECPPTGIFFYESSAEALIQAVHELDKITFDPQAIRQQALKFARPIFTRKLADYLNMRLSEKFHLRMEFPVGEAGHGA